MLHLVACQDIRGDAAKCAENGGRCPGGRSGADRWEQGDEYARDLVERDTVVERRHNVLVICFPGLTGCHQCGHAD